MNLTRLRRGRDSNGRTAQNRSSRNRYSLEDQLIIGIAALSISISMRDLGYRHIDMNFGSQLTMGVPNLDRLREFFLIG